jgi:hypothetical protein
MKKLVLSFFLISLILLFSSCKKINGKGDVVTETRDASGFRGISLAIDGDVHFTPDSVYHLEISGQQNILDVIETNVDGGTLTIKVRDNNTLGSHDPIVVTVSAPSVSTLTISGSGAMYVEAPWIGSSFTLNISGSGNLHAGEIDVNSLRANISGSGSISANTGTIITETLVISGSGSIEFAGVMSNDTYATISGSGNITAWVVNYLEATISGSGNIYYKGSPTIKTHISGSGKIEQIN